MTAEDELIWLEVEIAALNICCENTKHIEEPIRLADYITDDDYRAAIRLVFDGHYIDDVLEHILEQFRVYLKRRDMANQIAIVMVSNIMGRL